MSRELTDEEFVEALRLCRLADAAAEGGQTPAGHYLGKLRDLLAPTEAPSTGPWRHVRADEHLALCRVEMQAREAVTIARATGLHLGPLQAALDELARARGELPHWRAAAQTVDEKALER